MYLIYYIKVRNEYLQINQCTNKAHGYQLNVLFQQSSNIKMYNESIYT
jgi:hypothetical protein